MRDDREKCIAAGRVEEDLARALPLTELAAAIAVWAGGRKTPWVEEPA